MSKKLPIPIGEKYGRLTVVGESRRAAYHRQVECVCECGGSKTTSLHSLRKGVTQSCGCLWKETISRSNRVHVNIVGRRFGRLVILEEVERYGYVRQVKCKCDCGTVSVFKLPRLLYKRTKSCGCFRRDFTIAKNKTHGKAGTALYRRWHKMLERCRNPKDPRYTRYGGRGIRVCDEWQTFEGFCKDMEASFWDHAKQFGVDDTTIDRIDNDKNYGPENCRWATHEDNSRANGLAIWLEHDGKRMTTTQWAKHLGMTQGSLAKRLRNGWPIEKALTTPPRPARGA